jgi:hypothetical protein
MLVEKTANSLLVNDDWPVNAEVNGFLNGQKLLMACAWLLIILAVITAVYVRPGVRRVSPQPATTIPAPRFQSQDRLEMERQQRLQQERQNLQRGVPGQQGQPGAQPGGQQSPQGPGANQPPGGQVPPGQNPPGGQRPPGAQNPPGGQNPPGQQAPPKTGGK